MAESNAEVGEPDRHAARRPRFKYYEIVERLVWLVTILTAVGGFWKFLHSKRFVSHAPWEWLDKLDVFHFVLIMLVEVVLTGIFRFIHNLSRNLEHGIRNQLQVIEPHLGVVTRQSHRELYRLTADFLTLSGEIVKAIGAGSLDYKNDPFKDLLGGNFHLCSEFLYYWIIDSILSLKAREVTSLDMMHYLPAGGIYPVFIRRFQEAQRNIPADKAIRKIYRFRSEQYYDPDNYAPGSRQLFWSQLLMEESQAATILVDYGSDKANRTTDELEEVIIIEFKQRKYNLVERHSVKRLIAVAKKDMVSFEFRNGKIQLDR